MKKQYANVDEDIEEIVKPYEKTEKFIQPPPMPPKPAPVAVEGWPIPAEKARRMQAALGQFQDAYRPGRRQGDRAAAHPRRASSKWATSPATPTSIPPPR